MPNKVLDKVDAGAPDAVRVRIDRCEGIEQVLDVYVLQRDPLCFCEVGLVRVKTDRHPCEVTFFGCAKERRGRWILETEVVSEWREHRDESVAPVYQGKGAILVEDVRAVGDRRKQPIKVLFVDTLREEGNNSQNCSGVGAKFLE